MLLYFAFNFVLQLTMRFLLSGITSVFVSIVVVIEPTCSILCGKLEFEQATVEECQSARLTFTPMYKKSKKSRKWLKGDTSVWTVLYNSEFTNNETKYTELKSGDSFNLSVLAVDLTDTGKYIVHCERGFYSNEAYLNVTQSSTGQGCTEKCGNLSVKSTNVEEGDPAEFQFTVSPGRPVTWEKKRGSYFEQLVNGRYIKASNSENKLHSLTIVRTQFSDLGEYRVNCGTSVSNSIDVNIVYSKPSVPEFSNVVSANYCYPKGCILANINEVVTVECFVEGGSKPIDLNMLKNGKVITETTRTLTQIYANIYNYVKYSFKPTIEDVKDGVMLTCTVKNPALTDVLSDSTLLYVKVAPEKIEVNPIKTVENEQSEVQCIETSVRPPLKATLFISGRLVNSTSKKAETKPDNLYTITTSTTKLLTRFHNQVKVLCCSRVAILMCGETEINVLFPPKKMSVKELTKENQENGDTIVQLKYSVAESNPNSSVTLRGVKNIPRTLVNKKYEQDKETRGWTHSGLLSFNLTRDDDQREITFEAVTDRFPEQTLHYVYKINVTYYPKVVIFGNNIVYLGDDVILACHVNSNPPAMLSWYNQTDLIQETYGTEKLNLYLPNISTNHSQTYTCKANNGIGGMKSKNITLIVKDPSKRPENTAIKSSTESNTASVIGPIIGCITAVIILAIIVGFLIYKTRRNTSMERRNSHQKKNKEQKQCIGNGNNDSDTNVARQTQSGQEMNLILPVNAIETHVYSDIDNESGYEALAKQNTSKESELYTKLETNKQAQYDTLTKQSTSKEMDLYTKLETDKQQTEYEALTKEVTSKESDLYTELDSHTSTAIPSEYENLTP